MASVEFKNSSLGLTVAFDFAVDLLNFKLNQNIWLAIGRVFLRAINKLVLSPVKDLIIHVNEFREALIVEFEASRARINKAKIIEVTKVYEQGKTDVESMPLTFQAKQRLIQRLDVALEIQVDKIIELI